MVRLDYMLHAQYGSLILRCLISLPQFDVVEVESKVDIDKNEEGWMLLGR